MYGRWTPALLAAALMAALSSCAAVAVPGTSPESGNWSPAGAWDLTGADDAGIAWVATLVLGEEPNGDYAGHVDWIGASGASGREYIHGVFDDGVGSITFSGVKVEYGDRVVRCEYTAVLSPEGDRLEHGTWSHKDATVPGTWRAERVTF